MEFLEVATWVTIGKIILIDILLAGDNAVVIGMAAGKLAPELQKKAVIWGTVGAIVMRLVFATLLVEAARGHLELVIAGMLITVPIIVFCSTLFARIINKFPAILWAGGALLGWVAGEMIVEDPLLMPYIQGEELLVKFGTVFFVLIVTGMIKIWKKRDA